MAIFKVILIDLAMKTLTSSQTLTTAKTVDKNKLPYPKRKQKCQRSAVSEILQEGINLLAAEM